MHKFSVCFVILILSTIASTAKNYDLLPKSIHIMSSKGVEEYELTYDSDGRLLNKEYEVYYTDINSQKIIEDKRSLTCTYNSDGLIETESWDIFYLYSGMTITDVYRLFYEYNENGNVIEIYKEHYSNSTWSPYSKEVFTYYNDSLVKEELNQSYKNDDWQNTKRYTYEYDESGNRLSELWENWEDGGWSNYYLDTYVYNGGEIILHLTQKRENADWVNVRRYKYTYGTNLKVQSREDWEEEGWEIISRNSYEYDDNDNQLSYTRESIIDSILSNEYRKQYKYDSLGNKLTQTFEYWEDGAWDMRSRNVYTYNVRSYLISDYHQSIFNDEWFDVFRIIYEYDDNDYLISGMSQKYSSSSDSWNHYSQFMDIDIGVQFYNLNFGDINIEYIHINSVNNEIGRFNFCINNYPNPFNSKTTIEYSVKSAGACDIEIFNAKGGLVRQFDEYNPEAGEYSIKWDGRDDASNELPAGVYYVNIHANGQSGQFPVVLLR